MVAVSDKLIVAALDLCRPKARYYCRKYHAIDADDVLQDFALKLPSIFDAVRADCAWQPFVMQSFRNFCFSAISRRQRRRAVALGNEVHFNHYYQDDSADSLIALIDDEDTRRVLTLMFVEGETTRTVATQMSCTVRTVQRKLNSGLTELRERLGDP